jgi:hypothetical protein
MSCSSSMAYYFDSNGQCYHVTMSGACSEVASMVSQAPTRLWGRRVPRAMTAAPVFKKKKRGKWTAESMSLALDSIKSRQMNGREASHFYSIHESNIRSWKSKKVKSKKRGPPIALRSEEEILLVKWCEEMQEVAHCVTL